MNVKKSYKPIFTNMRRTPYRQGTTDRIQTKVEILKKNKLIHQANIPIELWFNFLGSWVNYEDYVTNRFGNQIMHYSCEGIPEITNCTGYAKITIDGEEYTSNIVRFNFVEGNEAVDLRFIIDASDDDTDRTSFDTFDAMDRSNTFNRMYGSY